MYQLQGYACGILLLRDTLLSFRPSLHSMSMYIHDLDHYKGTQSIHAWLTVFLTSPNKCLDCTLYLKIFFRY